MAPNKSSKKGGGKKGGGESKTGAAVRALEIPSLDLEASICVEVAGACAADAVKDARVAEL